jgi:hypothetical protein
MKEAAVKLAIYPTAAFGGAVLTGLAVWSLLGETPNRTAP